MSAHLVSGLKLKVEQASEILDISESAFKLVCHFVDFVFLRAGGREWPFINARWLITECLPIQFIKSCTWKAESAFFSALLKATRSKMSIWTYFALLVLC